MEASILATPKEERRHVLSVLVADAEQVLVRVAGLFSSRGYNISSLTVGRATSAEYDDRNIPLSRMTIITTCDDDKAEHICDQIRKLIDVFSACVITDEPRLVLADVTLVKVFVSDPEKQAQALQIASGMRGLSIITRPDYIIFRFIGRADASDFVENMERFGPVESVTSGTVALA